MIVVLKALGLILLFSDYAKGLELIYSITYLAVTVVGDIVTLLQSITSKVSSAFESIDRWQMFTKSYIELQRLLNHNPTNTCNKIRRWSIILETGIYCSVMTVNNWRWLTELGFVQVKSLILYYFLIVDHIRTILKFVVIKNINALYEILNTLLEQRYITPKISVK